MDVIVWWYLANPRYNKILTTNECYCTMIFKICCKISIYSNKKAVSSKYTVNDRITATVLWLQRS